MEYNIDFGNITLKPPPAPKPANQGPLYAAVDGKAASLSNNECVFQPTGGGELEVMTHQVLQALDQCREFHTLDEHVARVVGVVPGLAGQSEAVRRVLNGLISRGLLRSDEEFLAALTRTDDSRVPAPLRGLVVRACDRPAQVGRLLDSLLEQADDDGELPPLVLIDDSRDEEAARRHQEHLAALRKRTPVHYVGASQAREIAARLTRAVPEAAGLAPAMLGLGADSRFGGGRGYNLAMLLSAGQRLALLDDDYVLPFRTPAGVRSGLEPNPRTRVMTRFHESAEAALAAGEPAADGLERQLAMVGHSLGSLLAGESAYRLGREQLRGRTLARLAHLDGRARVLATFVGYRGDAFSSDNSWLYQLDKDARAEFWRERESYLRHVNADAVEIAMARLTAKPSGAHTPFMLDNSQLLPCTAPEGRGEDGLFDAVSRYLWPDSITLHLPLTVGHRQEGGRARRERGLQAYLPPLNHFLREWVGAHARAAHSVDPADRLRLLAAQLEDLAHAPEAHRIELLSEYLRYVRADLVEGIQQQIVAEPDAPVYWLADARAIVEANGKALLANAPPRLDGWPEDIDAAGCAQRLREGCLQLAQAWQAWPRLWAAAAEMGDKLLPR